MWPQMVKAFRRDVAPYVGMGIALGLVVGLIFGSVMNGVIIGSTIGTMNSNVYARSYRLVLSAGIGMMYGTMFHSIPMGMTLAVAIPSILELISLTRQRA